MTFAQLRTFALVAELGSLRAAATALGVSEPAVSAAVAALRADLGDPLFRRTGSGIALTPGGRALATRARELVRLADRTRREVGQASSAGRLRVLATAACAEHVAGAVVAAFTQRVNRTGVDLTVGSTDCAAAAARSDPSSATSANVRSWANVMVGHPHKRSVIAMLTVTWVTDKPRDHQGSSRRGPREGGATCRSRPRSTTSAPAASPTSSNSSNDTAPRRG